MVLPKYKNLSLSIFVNVTATVLVFKLFQSAEGIISPLYVFSLMAQLAFGILGILSFVFRVAGFLRSTSFIYIFIGVANAWIGLIFLYLFIVDHPVNLSIWYLLPNLLLGVLLLIDTFGSMANYTNTSSRQQRK